MSGDGCPCKGCTPETGRAPGCHTRDCPRGWYEWEQAHQSRKGAERQAYQADNAVNSILRNGATKARRKSK